MKIQVLALSALYLLTDSASARSYIERRACAKNNLMRTLERLQRESNFCVALLAPDPTVSVPSSIAATPLSTISSACNCIVATVTTMTTSSSSPTTSSTTSRTTSSTTSGCSVSTITEIPPPVTVTETVEPSTCTVTTEPGTCPPVSTVTESCTTSSDPTSVPTSYLFGFEEPSKLWGGSVRLNTMTRDFGYMGYGEHEDPALAHSGSYYYRFEFPIRYDGPQYARFGTLKSVPAIPNTQYQLDVWFRQFRYGEIICNSDVEVSTEGNFNVDGSGTVTGGWFVARSLLQTGLQWTKTTFTFSSRGYSSLSLFFFVECDCPRADNNCGETELKLWSFYRALIAEFIATLLFLYITVATVIGYKKSADPCNSVGLLGVAWAFGGMIFVLVYCTAGISGGHINPAVTFGLFLARKVSLIRAVAYMVAQCLGAICGVGLVKAFMKHDYNAQGGGANSVAHGYSKGTALGAEIIGTFVLVYTVFSATDPKRSARDSHVPVLAPLPIGFAVFIVHLATIPITGTGINPARSFGAAVIYDNDKIWDEHWIFWVGPFVGALAAAAYHQYILRAAAIKALGSFRSNPSN